MSNNNKERIIGSSILLGGGLLLCAVFYRVNYVNQPEVTASIPDQSAEVVEIQPRQDDPTMGELTADYETEQRILAQKKEERAARVAEQEKMLKDYVRIQEEANEQALKKADKEFAVDNPVEPEVVLEPVYTEDQLRKQAERKAELQAKREAKEKAREAEAREARLLAEKRYAEQKAAQEAKKREQQKQEQLAAQTKEKQKEKTAKQAQADYVAARNKLKAERAKASTSTEKGNFGVQVALAGNQALADDMVAKLKKYGYKVKTSQTSRGVRVIVGHERAKGAAIALKDKINADSRIGVDGAWVMTLRQEHMKAQNTQSSQKKKQQDQDKKKDEKLKKQILLAEKKANERQKEREQAAKKAAADKKAAEDETRYGIQVAMAGTKEDADRLIAKLKKNGYKVTTSNTTRGTRIIVGAGLKKADAQKLQAKVNSDSRVGISGAWMRRER